MGEDKRLEERTKFEEDNFTRITLNKKEKARMKRMANSSAMGDVITNFKDSKALWQDDDDDDGGGGASKGKKRKRDQSSGPKGGGGGKGGKKSKMSKGATKKMKSKKKKRFA